jgi:hypothetical protein
MGVDLHDQFHHVVVFVYGPFADLPDVTLVARFDKVASESGGRIYARGSPGGDALLMDEIAFVGQDLLHFFEGVFGVCHHVETVVIGKFRINPVSSVTRSETVSSFHLTTDGFDDEFALDQFALAMDDA